MKLSKKMALLGTLLAAQGAYAQSNGTNSVELYGTIDSGVGYAKYSLSSDPDFAVGLASIANAHGINSVTSLTNGGISPSNWGIKGSEDLGGGLRSFFRLESGFNSFNGVLSNGPASLVNNKSTNNVTVNGDSSLDGALFNRTAYIGIGSAQWGELTFGRNNSLGVDALIPFDPMGGSYLFGPFGYVGSPAGAGVTEDGRIDNSVTYRLRMSNGVNVGALYKFGGQAGSTDAQSEFQGTVGYTNGPFAIQGTYSEAKDAEAMSSNALGNGTVNLTVADTSAVLLAASYETGAFKFMGGYERITYQNPSNAARDLGITIGEGGYPVAAVSVTAYNKEKVEDIYYAGFIYSVTPALAAKFGIYDLHIENYNSSATPCNSSNSNVASCAGDLKFYSAMTTYALSKRTSLYAGISYNKNTGGQAVGFVHDSNTVIGSGVNVKF